MIDGPDITVITSTIPGREDFLAQCQIAVAGQTLKPAAHLVYFDVEHKGIQHAMNWLAEHCPTPWMQWVADDDLLLPRHLEVVANLADPADIVHSYCRVDGRPNFLPNYSAEESGYNMTATALMRKSMVDALGGWDPHLFPEDYHFWNKAGRAGYKFAVARDEITWVYRFHGGNLSWR